MENLFKGVFKNKRILITGDTGFKGSWLSIWLKEVGAQIYGYALPPKSEMDNFVRTGLKKKIIHRDGNVINYESFLSFAREANPEIVFHLAAQPLVIYSYENPRETYETNLMGTVNFLEIVRNLPSVKVAINITSDKCYDNRDWVWGYRENDPMGGKDPYSSSKGCSELITAAYQHSFFQNQIDKASIASARAGNVIGGGDWAEDRIVPDFFRAYKNNETLLVRNPEFTRPWQHVLEPLSGYLQLASALYLGGGKYSGGWNFGPVDSSHYSVKDLINHLITSFGSGSFTIPTTESKRYEAHLLKLDISKANKMLGWKPTLNFEQTVSFTVEGYKSEFKRGDIYEHRVSQIRDYIELASKNKINWAL